MTFRDEMRRLLKPAPSERRMHKDTLLRRVLWVHGITTALIVTAAVALAALWVIPTCQKIEAQELNHRKEIVRQAFSAQIDRLSDLTHTYAVWDDAYYFALGQEPAFTAANLSAKPLREINVSAVLIFGADDRLLFSTVSEHAPISRRLLLSVAGAVASAPGLAVPGHERTAVVTAPGEAALVTVMRIARTDGGGVSPGRMVFVRRIDEAFVGRLQQRTNTHLQLDIHEVGRVSRASDYVVTDAYDRPSLAFVIPNTTQISAFGRGAILLVALTAAAILAVVGLVMAQLLLRGVVGPVRELVADIDTGADIRRVPERYRNAPAEIVRLRDALAEASDRLREEIARERAATEEARQARSAAEIANRAKSHFMARVSHELRTPLHAVIGFGELLQDSLLQAGRASDREDVERMLAAARRLLSNVNDLIDMARLESGRMPLARNSVDVEALMREAVQSVQPIADEGRTKIDLRLEAELGLVTTDERRLRQCLVNLVSNAVRFAPEGQVTVSARRGRRRDEESIVFSIRDNGVGMSPSQLNRAFEPFMQAEEDTHLKHGGLGLGLTITRGLVSLLGGRLDAESEPGKGTHFRIILPVEAAAAPVWGGVRAA